MYECVCMCRKVCCCKKSSLTLAVAALNSGAEEATDSALKGKMKRSERDAWALRAVGLLESFDMADLMHRVMRDACRLV